MSDISDRIETDALKPQSTSVDGTTVVRRSLTEQIAADRYARDVAAATPTNAASLFKSMNCKIVAAGGH